MTLNLTGHVALPEHKATAASTMPPSMPRAATSMWHTPPTTPSMSSIPPAGKHLFSIPDLPAWPAPW